MNQEPYSFRVWLRAGVAIYTTSMRRLLWTWQSVICAIVLVLLNILAYASSKNPDASESDKVQMILVTIFGAVFLPLVALCFGSASIGRERDSRTLVYLIATPTPRPLVYLSKFVAAASLTLVWSCGGYILLLTAARIASVNTIAAYLPAICLGAIAYVALFQLLSVSIRFHTILAFVYAVFVQNTVTLMPGTTKRIAVSYYVQCMMMDASRTLDLKNEKLDLLMTDPLSGSMAMIVLIGITICLLALGSYVFWRKEYV